MATTLSLPPIDLLAAAAAELAQQARNAGDGARERAVNKAAAQLHSGCSPLPTASGFLVESRTAPGIVYRVSTVYGCGCTAGQKQAPCWHAALLTIIEQAQARALPALPLAARLAKARAEVDELFA